MSLEDAIDSLNFYVQTGTHPGSFLTAVLENDLMEAMNRADDSSRVNLFEICCYVYNDMPAVCWGSPAKVDAWRTAQIKEREAQP